MRNPNSLDTICAALTYALGVEPPKHAAAPNADLAAYIDRIFDGEKADRVFMYNPDAVAQWIFEKYQHLCPEVRMNAEQEIPLCTVMPSVTPVCFGTMYTGAQPAVHGIQKYEKPVIKIDTIFDALIRAGKKPAIIAASPKCSMSNIFLERDMDYFITARIDEALAIASELIIKDEYDFILCYNANFDDVMHKKGPESPEAIAQMGFNFRTFCMYDQLIKNHWGHHNVLIGTGMDHGCHETPEGKGTHCDDAPYDRNIVHYYKIYPAQK